MMCNHFEFGTDFLAPGGRFKIANINGNLAINGFTYSTPFPSKFGLTAESICIIQEQTCLVHSLHNFEPLCVVSEKIKDIVKCFDYAQALIFVTQDNRLLAEHFTIWFDNYILDAVINKYCYVSTMGCFMYVFRFASDFRSYKIHIKRKFSFNVKRILVIPERQLILMSSLNNEIYIADLELEHGWNYINTFDLKSFIPIIKIDDTMKMYWDVNLGKLLLTSHERILVFDLNSKVPTFFVEANSQILDFGTLGDRSIITLTQPPLNPYIRHWA